MYASQKVFEKTQNSALCVRAASDWVIYEDVGVQQGIIRQLGLSPTHKHAYTDAYRELGQHWGASEPAVG